MAKGNKTRQGKVVTAGHSTRVEGLARLIATIESWPEITTIRIGQIQRRNAVGRKSKRLKQNSGTTPGFSAVQGHKRARGGGGFSFRATRPAIVGSVTTGIKCDAAYGTEVQEVILCGDDLDALKRRLHSEGYGAEW
jgi:hypothetical protein